MMTTNLSWFIVCLECCFGDVSLVDTYFMYIDSIQSKELCTYLLGFIISLVTEMIERYWLFMISQFAGFTGHLILDRDDLSHSLRSLSFLTLLSQVSNPQKSPVQAIRSILSMYLCSIPEPGVFFLS